MHTPQAPSDPQTTAARPRHGQAATATTPMFHRCCHDDIDVPSVLPRAASKPARRAPVPLTVASMISRRPGEALAELARSLLRSRCATSLRPGAAPCTSAAFATFFVVDPGFVADRVRSLPHAKYENTRRLTIEATIKL